MNNSLHLWSEEILLVEEWISLDSNSSRVKIHYSASEISSSSLDIHSKRSDNWHHYPRSENRVNWVVFLFREYKKMKDIQTNIKLSWSYECLWNHILVSEVFFSSQFVFYIEGSFWHHAKCQSLMNDSARVYLQSCNYFVIMEVSVLKTVGVLLRWNISPISVQIRVKESRSILRSLNILLAFAWNTRDKWKDNHARR